MKKDTAVVTKSNTIIVSSPLRLLFEGITFATCLSSITLPYVSSSFPASLCSHWKCLYIKIKYFIKSSCHHNHYDRFNSPILNFDMSIIENFKTNQIADDEIIIVNDTILSHTLHTLHNCKKGWIYKVWHFLVNQKILDSFFVELLSDSSHQWEIEHMHRLV